METNTPIKRIIVAYDGSEQAKRAFAYAVMFAERMGSKVVGVHVSEQSDSVPAPAGASLLGDEIPPLAEMSDVQRRERTKAIDDEFDDMADYCWEREVDFKGVHLSGVLSDELMATVTAEDLLAVGQKGRMAKTGFGSLSRQIIKHAPCPVMMASGELRPVMRVLAAFDGSPPSLRAVQFGRTLAEAANLPLNILSVGGVTWSSDDTLEAAQAMAGDAMVLAVGPGDESQADQILRASKHAGLAIIVLGAFPDSWMHQLIFGSSTDKVLSSLEAPVIIVH